jgi:alpha-L-arabinofuranosidase
MEIGNENGGADYNARYDLFRNAIKAKYPNVELVVCDWGGVPKTPFDYMDSHHYGTPQSFLQQVGRYDNADRNGPKVYFGEYAVTNQAGKGNGQAAVAEAAFLTGLERNSDVVRMSSYAPLLVRKGWDRWNPNAIVFDQSQVYGTPSYWLQTMFAGNRPDRTIPTQVEAATPVENIHGQIGVGTWATQAEFKDIKVTKGTQTLFASNFATGTDGWKTPRGQWSVVDGALRQTGNENNAIALIGDPTWSDYTLTLKARKLSGAEGFLITFGSTDAGTNSWWNIGGWNNTQHGIEYDGVNAPRINGRIENGRWYDIKIELQGQTIKLYLDGQLVQTATRTGVAPLTAVAGRDDKTGETIIKVVNTGAQTLETSINLNGIKAAPLTGTAWTLNCPNRLEENSFEAPTKIAPKAEQLSLTGPSFTRVFPAQSVTVMRLKAAH